MSYFTAIKTACLFFPFVALLFTIPFVLYQYHKYGSVNKFRCLIVYSYILYMITVYFLVILPLPHISEVAYRPGMVRLVPGGFILDILKEANFVFRDFSTYLNILKTPAVMTTLLNILMTVPFGMYLRYYFKCDVKKTCILSFCLSLFFELTQLSRLYFIYPYPYRVFDVDDLIMNTLGGALGFYVISLVGKFLPSREKIDEESLREGRKVSGFRRFTVYCLDLLLFHLLVLFIKNGWMKLFVFLIYYAIIPTLTDGLTIGSKFLNVRLKTEGMSCLRYFLRFLLVYFYYFRLPFYVVMLEAWGFEVLGILSYVQVILYFITGLGILLFYQINVSQVLRNQVKFYDSLFKIEYQSTIKNK